MTDGGGAALLVENRDHGVCGVRDEGAEDTSPVTRDEGDEELGALRVGVLGQGEDVLVEGLYSVFEGSKLDHGVGNLPHPQGRETLVESVNTFLGSNLVESLSEASGESSCVSCLHSNFELFAKTY